MTTYSERAMESEIENWKKNADQAARRKLAVEVENMQLRAERDAALADVARLTAECSNEKENCMRAWNKVMELRQGKADEHARAATYRARALALVKLTKQWRDLTREVNTIIPTAIAAIAAAEQRGLERAKQVCEAEVEKWKKLANSTGDDEASDYWAEADVCAAAIRALMEKP